jgi:hypothetical protein
VIDTEHDREPDHGTRTDHPNRYVATQDDHGKWARPTRTWPLTSVVVPLIRVPLAPPAADAHRVWKKT